MWDSRFIHHLSKELCYTKYMAEESTPIERESSDWGVEKEEREKVTLFWHVSKEGIQGVDFFSKLEDNKLGQMFASVIFYPKSTLVKLWRVHQDKTETYTVTDETAPQRTKDFAEFICKEALKQIKTHSRLEKEEES